MAQLMLGGPALAGLTFTISTTRSNTCTTYTAHTEFQVRLPKSNMRGTTTAAARRRPAARPQTVSKSISTSKPTPFCAQSVANDRRDFEQMPAELREGVYRNLLVIESGSVFIHWAVQRWDLGIKTYELETAVNCGPMRQKPLGTNGAAILRVNRLAHKEAKQVL